MSSTATATPEGGGVAGGDGTTPMSLIMETAATLANTGHHHHHRHANAAGAQSHRLTEEEDEEPPPPSDTATEARELRARAHRRILALDGLLFMLTHGGLLLLSYVALRLWLSYGPDECPRPSP